MKKLIASLALLVVASLTPAPASTGMVCELTGTVVESCCCIPATDGGMVCTLTGETVSSCCCQ